MKHTHLFFSTALFLVALSAGSQSLFASSNTVTVTDKGNYFEVIQDYEQGVSHYEMGAQFYQQILLALPNYEKIVDSYLAELFPNTNTFKLMISRVDDIKPQISSVYRDEIDGMGSKAGATENVTGDGKLSIGELYLMQVLTDVARSTECSGISVFGSRSVSGSPMTARILDWNGGSKNQLPQIQSVTTVKNGKNSICIIGYLGLVGSLTGFNSDGVFAAILDSPSEQPFSSKNKRSYIYDIRFSLENFTTLSDVATFLSDTSKKYTYNHLVLLSDKNSSGVLENNFSGAGTNIRRALRKDTSTLNPGITWGFPNAIGVVNSFLLSGNLDNHTNSVNNTARWESIKNELQSCGNNVTNAELKQLISFDNNDGPQSQSVGDLYNQKTQQIALFEPINFNLEVSFRPKQNSIPTDPVFETVPINFTTSHIKKGLLPQSKLMLQLSNRMLRLDGTNNIVFSLSKPANVTVHIFDVLGREVRSDFLGLMPAGVHKQQYSMHGLSIGLYYYQVNEGSPSKIRDLR